MSEKKNDELNIYQKILVLQEEIRVKKSNRNEFANFNYRSISDIFNELKPLMKKLNLVINFGSGKLDGEKYLLEMRVFDSDNPESKIVEAGEIYIDRTKAKMDLSQKCLSAKTFLKKSLLEDFLLINEDADPDSHDNRNNETIDGMKKEVDRLKKENSKTKEEYKKIADNFKILKKKYIQLETLNNFNIEELETLEKKDEELEAVKHALPEIPENNNTDDKKLSEEQRCNILRRDKVIVDYIIEKSTFKSIDEVSLNMYNDFMNQITYYENKKKNKKPSEPAPSPKPKPNPPKPQPVPEPVPPYSPNLTNIMELGTKAGLTSDDLIKFIKAKFQKSELLKLTKEEENELVEYLEIKVVCKKQM